MLIKSSTESFLLYFHAAIRNHLSDKPKYVCFIRSLNCPQIMIFGENFQLLEGRKNIFIHHLGLNLSQKGLKKEENRSKIKVFMAKMNFEIGILH